MATLGDVRVRSRSLVATRGHIRLPMIHRSCRLTRVSQQAAASTGHHPGTLDPNTHQGKFGEHLVQLVVAAAGFSCSKPEDYGDGVDVTIARTHPDEAEIIIPPGVDLQVKSSRILRHSDDSVTYDLEVPYYNRLRARSSTPRYLILVDVRGDQPSSWVGYGADFGVIHKVAYWRSLLGFPATANTSTIAVSIPKRNRFTHSTVQWMMSKARDDYLASIANLTVRATT